MEEYLKKLDGITEKEWDALKILIDNSFYEERKKNTFKCDENVLKSFKAIWY